MYYKTLNNLVEADAVSLHFLIVQSPKLNYIKNFVDLEFEST